MPIQLDQRLGSLRGKAFVLEYHPEYFPGDDARSAIEGAFTSAGFTILVHAEEHFGRGVVWCVKF